MASSSPKQTLVNNNIFGHDGSSWKTAQGFAATSKLSIKLEDKNFLLWNQHVEGNHHFIQTSSIPDKSGNPSAVQIGIWSSREQCFWRIWTVARWRSTPLHVVTINSFWSCPPSRPHMQALSPSLGSNPQTLLCSPKGEGLTTQIRVQEHKKGEQIHFWKHHANPRFGRFITLSQRAMEPCFHYSSTTYKQTTHKSTSQLYLTPTKPCSTNYQITNNLGCLASLVTLY